MGLFQQLPEEPGEWAGLPAEPWEPDFDEGASTVSTDIAGTIPGTTDATKSISVPLPVTDPDIEPGR